MKVKITKKNKDNDRCWYNKRIGETFEVCRIREHDGCYMVIDNSPANWEGVLSYVLPENCVEVKE